MTDDELDARFERFAADIKDGVKAEITAEIKAEGETTRRHFDVVADGLKADIKVIADGHAALHDDMVGVRTGQARLEVRQERLEIRQLALEHRQGKLEERQGNLEERQGKLEERQGTLEERQGKLEEGVETLSEGQQELVDGQRSLVTEVRLLAARLPA
jgi:chromosome segregation ATPase